MKLRWVGFLYFLHICVLLSVFAIDDISKELAPLLTSPTVPSLAAAVVVDGELAAYGATGIRKRGAEEAVSLQDKYHLGSCTKSMTATLAAILVEKGHLDWHTKASDVFADMAIHTDYADVTLKQLLSNTGGCPETIEPELWGALWKARGTYPEQRMKLVRGILSQPAVYPPGQGYTYSNAGFSIAGAMMETVMKKPFEQLMREELFEPLGMDSVGFGAPGKNGTVDQPYGHNPDPVDPEPKGDNPPAIAPAGRVHASILDFARYARFHLGAGDGSLLSKETLDFLHTTVPPSADYALGWTVTERDWAGGVALTHAGSNTMFFAVIWLAPAENFAAVSACNSGVDEGFQHCDNAIRFLIERYLKE
jgi:CubicO group peptidase (beta-lactamase class C family)